MLSLHSSRSFSSAVASFFETAHRTMLAWNPCKKDANGLGSCGPDNHSGDVTPSIQPGRPDPPGRKGVWGGREPGAEGRLGRNGGWGGRELGARFR